MHRISFFFLWPLSLSFTGNSNSLAQLVDNEIPLAQMDMPAYTQQTATQVRQFRHHKQRASNGGSAVADLAYENQLAAAGSEDELDNADVVVVGGNEVVAAVAAIAASSKAREMRNRNNRSGSYSNLFDVDFDASLVTSAAPPPPALLVGESHKSSSAGAALLAAAINGATVDQQPRATLPKSVSQTENMYSNVPQVTVVSPSVPDAALHVYSNIIDERAQQQQQSQQLLQQQRQRQQAEQLQVNAVLSSTLLSDDLDLDDPVSASFHQHHSHRKSAGDGAEQAKSADRLRMLHDTTMIDTALDLDSLDGSSMGNSSQSCLVKVPAKVAAPTASSGSNGPIV